MQKLLILSLALCSLSLSAASKDATDANPYAAQQEAMVQFYVDQYKLANATLPTKPNTMQKKALARLGYINAQGTIVRPVKK